MSKASKDAIKRELVERATGKGKEPSWEGQPTQLQLVKALNFYSATVEVEKLHDYAKAWAKKHAPAQLEVISAQPAWKFQTIGALMRIQSRGLELSKEHAQQITDFINGLEMPVVDPTKSTSKGKKKMSKSTNGNENANYRNFCDALDGAVTAGKFKEPKFEVVKGQSVTGVVEACERELESMKEDPSIYPEHMKKWFRAVVKHVGGQILPANDASKAKKAAKPVTITAEPQDAEPVAKPAATKAPRQPKAAAPKAAKPAKVLDDQPTPNADCPLTGKKVAYIFDPRYGRLTKMVAGKGGFQVKGKTIHGIDEKASKVALLKNFGKPEALNDDLEGWMGKCVKKGNPIPVSTRLSAELMVLQTA